MNPGTKKAEPSFQIPRYKSDKLYFGNVVQIIIIAGRSRSKRFMQGRGGNEFKKKKT